MTIFAARVAIVMVSVIWTFSSCYHLYCSSIYRLIIHPLRSALHCGDVGLPFTLAQTLHLGMNPAILPRPEIVLILLS